jgi:hypothetical protein
VDDEAELVGDGEGLELLYRGGLGDRIGGRGLGVIPVLELSPPQAVKRAAARERVKISRFIV